jgi:hypothetical protein
MFEVKTVRVFRNGAREQNTTLFVQPGKDVKDTGFLDADGNPLMISVQFKGGKADVPEQLGRWLLDKGYAAREHNRIVELSA